jgi:hypothetical protein
LGAGFGDGGSPGAMEVGLGFSLVCNIGRVSPTTLLIGAVSVLCVFFLEPDRTMSTVLMVMAIAQVARSIQVTLSSVQ